MTAKVVVLPQKNAGEIFFPLAAGSRDLGNDNDNDRPTSPEKPPSDRRRAMPPLTVRQLLNSSKLTKKVAQTKGNEKKK